MECMEYITYDMEYYIGNLKEETNIKKVLINNNYINIMDMEDYINIMDIEKYFNGKEMDDGFIFKFEEDNVNLKYFTDDLSYYIGYEVSILQSINYMLKKTNYRIYI